MSQENKNPNVLLLLVDALWFDRLGCSGHTPSVAPFIDRLIEKSVLATNMYAAGCPTQFAFPPIFTSTLPLDHHGYGMGIKERGTSFVECLKTAGFSTGAFVSAGYGSRFFGYDRGFDAFHELFDLSLFVRIIRDFHLGYYAPLVADGTIDAAVFIERNRPVLERAFNALARFCLDKIDEVASGAVIRSPVIHAWDFQKVARLVQEQQMAFSAAPSSYLENLISTWQTDPLFGAIGSARAAPQAASGAYVCDALCRWLVKKPKKPFFAWAHLMDVHDSNYTTYDFCPPRDVLQEDARALMNTHAKILHKGTGYTSDLGHDYALAYTDRQIARLYDFLARNNLLSETLIVITSDHGCRTAGQPRPDFKDITAFFDQLYHVPLALIHPGLQPRKIDSLCSTMDLAPTLLDILEIPVPSSYRGAPIDSAAASNRNHLIMEHVGRGPCDFELKPINICVRTKTTKAIFRSSSLQSPPEVFLEEVYDLHADKNELNNIAQQRGNDSEIAGLSNIALARIKEIRADLQKPLDAARYGGIA